MRWCLRESRMDVREIVTCGGVCVKAERMCVRLSHAVAFASKPNGCA